MRGTQRFDKLQQLTELSSSCDPHSQQPASRRHVTSIERGQAPMSVAARSAAVSATNRIDVTLRSHRCRLTVELSGAHADVWAWHFIFHASAPAIC